MNSNGLMLFNEFCARIHKSVMGTMLKSKNSLKNTWQHLLSMHWHQLNHVLADQAAKQQMAVYKRKSNCGLFHPSTDAGSLWSLRKEELSHQKNKYLTSEKHWEDRETEWLRGRELGGIQRCVSKVYSQICLGEEKKTQNEWSDDKEIQRLLKDNSLNRSILRQRIEQPINWRSLTHGISRWPNRREGTGHSFEQHQSWQKSRTSWRYVKCFQTALSISLLSLLEVLWA